MNSSHFLPKTRPLIGWPPGSPTQSGPGFFVGVKPQIKGDYNFGIITWQISVLHLQIFPVHSPVAKLDPSKYVQFSDEVEPHPIETRFRIEERNDYDRIHL